MKIEVYNLPVPKPEPAVLLAFELGRDTSKVIVTAVDNQGERLSQGDLIVFLEDGTIYRPGDVNPDLGFKLDDAGRIVMGDE
ncbi:hypothetical protein IMZ48_26135 [Candidatus Bathyarchaeota archaeon]|nr:hypothetical protein [Candidatus Bathyarchaeota archaeon]